MRTFIAIPLPPASRAAIAEARRVFVETAPDWAGEKWVANVNLHVTLEFLGDVPDGALDDVLAATAAACERHGPFALSLGAVAGKPSGRARMLWVRTADGVEAARALQADLHHALAPLLGLEDDARGYTPHITLARLRRPRRVPPEALAAADAVLDSAAVSCGTAAGGTPATIVSVTGVSVVSSRTLPAGPVYEELAFVPLATD